MMIYLNKDINNICSSITEKERWQLFNLYFFRIEQKFVNEHTHLVFNEQ